MDEQSRNLKRFPNLSGFAHTASVIHLWNTGGPASYHAFWGNFNAMVFANIF